jgi:hypothetical protein
MLDVCSIYIAYTILRDDVYLSTHVLHRAADLALVLVMLTCLINALYWNPPCCITLYTLQI